MSYELVQARAADLHRQAQRDALARTAARARRTQAPRRSQPLRRLPAAVAHSVLTTMASAKHEPGRPELQGET
jgi:hypothetical protein